MTLKEYRRKRDFRKTPEPAGRERKGQGRLFVVQKHDASRLHYDFRLELDGVLKSWAVPKGPSPEPKGKSLAVEVEDHPLDYADFEGTIPQGEYGGGTVMVWDTGTWEPEGDAANGLRQGKLTFTLNGEKLRGQWTLVRMADRERDRGRHNWLLIHRQGQETTTQRDRERSVFTGRTMDQIAAAGDRVWRSNRAQEAKRSKQPTASNGKRQRPAARATRRQRATKAAKQREVDPSGLTGARRRPMPAKIEPQLATLVAEVPAGREWLHEFKYDGYRILARIDGERIDLLTRRGNNWTARFPAAAAALAELGLTSAILDGEIVALDEQGATDFQKLQNWLQRGDDRSLVYYLFDVPYLEGYDLCRSPLVERKKLLAGLLAGGGENDGLLRYSDDIRGQGAKVVEYACQAGMEGVVSKREDSHYAPGRTQSWLKTKCLQRQEFVIGGYTQPAGARQGFGSLLLGYYQGGKLHYAGRVGTGFTQQSLADLSRRLKALRSPRPAFVEPPPSTPRQRATWVRPELVAEVQFAEWTEDGVLRHPSFQGLREDKPAAQITAERPSPLPDEEPPMKQKRRVHKRSAMHRAAAAGEVRVAGVLLSNPERVYYPELELTKLDLARYYESIPEWVLPHLTNRPLTMVRCPSGYKGQCFYQKHLAEKLPEALRTVSIKEKSATRQYVVLDDLAGLVSLAQRGVLELHPWPAPADDLERPDRLVIDLDPGEGSDWKAVLQATREVREYLEGLELACFVRTTGGKGLHVVAPLAPHASWEEHKTFAATLAQTLVARSPDLYVATMSKALRKNKVFIDYLRNQRGATAIASYSSRAREGAPVATPLAWDELSPKLQPARFTVQTVPKRLASLRGDPWEGFDTARQKLTSRLLEAAQSVLAEVRGK